MKMITLIIFGVICLGLDILYALFSNSKGYKSALIKGLTILSILVLAVVSANLNSVTSAISIFIFLGLGFSLLGEAMTITDIEEEKPRMIAFGMLKGIAIALFAVGAVTLSGFNVFALGSGLLIGLGIGCIICSIKKHKKIYQLFSTAIIWGAIGLLVGESVFALLNSVRFMSSLIMAGAGGLMIISQLIDSFAKEGSKLHIISHFMYGIALSAIAVSIYFY